MLLQITLLHFVLLYVNIWHYFIFIHIILYYFVLYKTVTFYNNNNNNNNNKFEWSHPVVLSEYLLYYNIFPSTQLTFKV